MKQCVFSALQRLLLVLWNKFVSKVQKEYSQAYNVQYLLQLYRTCFEGLEWSDVTPKHENKPDKIITQDGGNTFGAC